MTGAPRSPPPAEVARGVAAGRLRLLDLRTRAEPAVLGAPPGAQPVGLLRHVLHPQGEDAVYVRPRRSVPLGAASRSGTGGRRLPALARREAPAHGPKGPELTEVRLLFSAGCPNRQQAAAVVRQALTQVGQPRR